jgi:hypothetical protein
MQPAAPNSPEALKAARKLLNGFLFLAALNLLVIAFAFWPGSRKETPSSADLPAMREVLEAAQRLAAGRCARVFHPLRQRKHPAGSTCHLRGKIHARLR